MTEEHPGTVLRRLEQRARRRFGQHFLWREDVVERIVLGAHVEPGDKVLEVGPGLGILTRALLRAGADLTAVELDRDLAAWLRESLPDLRLVEADATRIDLAEVCPGGGWKVVANLPYNVGTGLVADWVRHPDTFTSLTVMLQKEVVERLVAVPGTKAYGALTLQVRMWAEPRFVVLVPPSAFHPRPKVQSAVVRLELRETPACGPGGPETFERVVRAAFAHRRKTLLNSLSSAFDRKVVVEALEAAGIDPNLRAERLDAEAFQRLGGALAGHSA